MTVILVYPSLQLESFFKLLELSTLYYGPHFFDDDYI